MLVTKPPFSPISFTFTFETEEEYKAFYEVCNYSSAIRALLIEKGEDESLPIHTVLSTIYESI